MAQVFFIEEVLKRRGAWASDMACGATSEYVARYNIYHPYLKQKFQNFTGLISFLNDLDGPVLLDSRDTVFVIWVSTKGDEFTMDVAMSGYEFSKSIPSGGVWDYE